VTKRFSIPIALRLDKGASFSRLCTPFIRVTSGAVKRSRFRTLGFSSRAFGRFIRAAGFLRVAGRRFKAA